MTRDSFSALHTAFPHSILPSTDDRRTYCSLARSREDQQFPPFKFLAAFNVKFLPLKFSPTINVLRFIGNPLLVDKQPVLWLGL